ncbi:MAG: hypothetical protein K0Q59_722 [Paenibacillus sp.]|nr:hypothetical protein [Paenibacillus sp.]
MKNPFSDIAWKSPLESKISPIYSKATDDYVAGVADLNTIMRKAEEDINKLIAEQSAK